MAEKQAPLSARAGFWCTLWIRMTDIVVHDVNIDELVDYKKFELEENISLRDKSTAALIKLLTYLL